MRIVGGKWRGRQLAAPEGKGTRPTTDRVREQVASMVLSAAGLDLRGVRVLDAFAGSGALGLEMLSRGALSCTFVERDRRAAEVIRRNIKTVGATPAEARLKVADAFRLAERGELLGGPFGLVLLDPPYATEAEQVTRLVEGLRKAELTTRGALVLYERAADAPSLDLSDAVVLRTKARGTTATDLMRLDAPLSDTGDTPEGSR